MILRVHHAQITIPPGEEDKARTFYCGVLGLKEIAKPGSLIARGGFWMELGETQIHVGTENGVERERSKAHVAYLVEDLDACRERLEKNNVEIIEGIEIPDYRRFEFRDPFGNRVEFLEKIV